jgi:hypothetical protein
MADTHLAAAIPLSDTGFKSIASKHRTDGPFAQE